MTGDRASVVAAAGAAAWLVAAVAVDIATPGPALVLTGLFGLAPLIACTVLSRRVTVLFAAAAVLMAAGSVWWDHVWSMQQLVRIADVVLLSGAAVLVAAVRVRREGQYARVAAIADVAQRAVLPRLPERVRQVEVAARYLSAAQDAVVGGDLYDLYYSEDRLRLLVADVRGKGLGAVEHAARVIRAFRQAAAREASLTGTAADMSRYLAPFFDDEEFVTALLVDASQPCRLTMVSCGHPPPLLVRSGGAGEFVEAPPGLPLGLGEDYEEISVGWAAGDRLLMYTDGLSEARDENGEFFPVHRLSPSLLTGGTLGEALDGLIAQVSGYVPHGELIDDLAVMLVQHTPVSASVAPRQRLGDALGEALAD